MHLALWIVQALLALAFAGAGTMKLVTPEAELVNLGMGGWVPDSPVLLVRFIGLSEVLGALGLILPAASRTAPGLTPLAALGLGTIMALGAGTHLAYGEFPNVVPTLVLGSLAAFVAWGRLRRHPILPRAAT